MPNSKIIIHNICICRDTLTDALHSSIDSANIWKHFEKQGYVKFESIRVKKVIRKSDTNLYDTDYFNRSFSQNKIQIINPEVFFLENNQFIYTNLDTKRLSYTDINLSIQQAIMMSISSQYISGLRESNSDDILIKNKDYIQNVLYLFNQSYLWTFFFQEEKNRLRHISEYGDSKFVRHDIETGGDIFDKELELGFIINNLKKMGKTDTANNKTLNDAASYLEQIKPYLAVIFDIRTPYDNITISAFMSRHSVSPALYDFLITLIYFNQVNVNLSNQKHSLNKTISHFLIKSKNKLLLKVDITNTSKETLINYIKSVYKSIVENAKHYTNIDTVKNKKDTPQKWTPKAFLSYLGLIQKYTMGNSLDLTEQKKMDRVRNLFENR